MSHAKPHRLAILLCLFYSVTANSQSTAYPLESIIESLVEEEQTDEQVFPIESIYNISLGQIYINSAQVVQLVDANLLSPIHTHALDIYIQINGPLISLYELQAVPHFSLNVIKQILPFISIKESNLQPKSSILRQVKAGRNQVILRWGQIMEMQNAYIPSQTGSKFRGNRSRLYFKYRHQQSGKLSFGVTAEKDPGEEFFKGSNKLGFDYYSAHLFIKNAKPWIPSIAIGDYSVRIGHGLILSSGFTMGKSAMTTRIIRGGKSVSPYTSVGEFAFFRGAAIELRPLKHISTTLFFSHRKQDAVTNTDTLDLINGTQQISHSFSSLQQSGYHRSDSEIGHFKKVKHTIFGGSVTYQKKQLKVDLNLVSHSFDAAQNPSDQFYAIHRFSGRSITNASLSYQYHVQNAYLFGEFALSQNNTIAAITGCMLALHKKLDVALLARFLPSKYQHYQARTFGESSTAENEIGIYIGTEIRPSRNWMINAYSDIWKHPAPRFGVDAPSTGNEQLIRVTFHKRHHSTFYMQFRNEQKDKNATKNSSPIDFIVKHRRQSLRIHFAYVLKKGIELRNRIEFSMYQEQFKQSSKGFLVYQDLIFKPIATPFTFTARIALFDTQDYSSRIYAYENDMSYQFSIPAYSYRGIRYYINFKYSGIRGMALEARIAQTRYSNRNQIGSGGQLINGNKKTDVKLQARFSF